MERISKAASSFRVIIRTFELRSIVCEISVYLQLTSAAIAAFAKPGPIFAAKWAQVTGSSNVKALPSGRLIEKKISDAYGGFEPFSFWRITLINRYSFIFHSGNNNLYKVKIFI